MGKKITSSIELTDSHIKVLQVCRVKGGPALTHCHVMRIPPSVRKDDTAGLAKILKEVKIPLDNLIAVLPRRLATITNLKLPTHLDREIKKMVSLQVVNAVPYAREEIILDYVILEKHPSGYTRVMVVVVPKEAIYRYWEIFKQAGLAPMRLTLSSEGLYYWYLYQKSNNKRVSLSSHSAVIHIDVSHTEICFCQADRWIFSREIPWGAVDLNPQSTEAAGQDIHLTLTTYQKEHMGDEITEMIVVAPQKEGLRLVERLKEEYKIPIYAISSLEEFPCHPPYQSSGADRHAPLAVDEEETSYAASLKKNLEQQGVSAALGLGLLFAKTDKFLNLLPEEFRSLWRTTQKRRQWLRSAVFLSITLVMGMLGWVLKVHRDLQYWNQLHQQVHLIQLQAQEVDGKMRRFKWMKEAFNQTRYVLDLMEELYRITPDGVALTLFDLDSQRTLTLQGVATEGMHINHLQEKMANSPLFTNVSLEYVSKRMAGEKDIIDFKIICQWKGRDF